MRLKRQAIYNLRYYELVIEGLTCLMMTSLFIDSSFAQFPNNPIPKNYAEDIFTAQTTS